MANMNNPGPNSGVSLGSDTMPPQAAGPETRSIKINNDTLAGIIMLVYSLIHIFYLTPDQVELHQRDTLLALSPRLFCYITGGTLGVLSAALIIMSLGPKTQKAYAETPPKSWRPLRRGLLCTAMACGYVALASVLGFFTSTVLAMIVFLLYFGVRSWSGILVFLVVVMGFLYLFFVEALKVVMPEGLFY